MDDERPRDIASSCVRRCCLDPNDICLGCFRSLAEISAWAAADRGQRLSILQKCAARRRTSE